MKTPVVIIGGGPAGLLLSQRLHLQGIESLVLERQTRAYVLARIRAGVLEWGSVEVLRDSGIGERDAAHIVPPTGAKGLNLAISDVFYLSRALTAHFKQGNDAYLSSYSDMALRRVWGAARFSWWLTSLLHRFPGQEAFDLKAQEQELGYLSASEAYMKAVCEQYAGLPFEG